MKSEIVHFPDYFRGLKETEKQLDPVNIRILSAMWKYGPRNLLEVSRRTGLPFTTVYHRMGKLEAKSGRVAYLLTPTSRLGMVRTVVLVAAKAGCGQVVTSALKIPNLWRMISACEGAFTHLSVHTVPIKFLKDFRKYVGQLSELGLVTESKLILTGDTVPNFPNFRYYNAKLNRWTFPWRKWLAALKKRKPRKALEDPSDYPQLADRKDLLIIKELEKNARTTFAELAPILGITLQGVKHRYDKRLLPAGIIRPFAFDVYPYPVEVSAYHELLLEFANKHALTKFYSLLPELMFVRGIAKVLHRNALTVTTYLPETQLPNMLDFFSEMAKAGMLESYSSVRLSFARRETQTISYELFDDEKGWMFDMKRCLSELRELAKGKSLLASRSTER